MGQQDGREPESGMSKAERVAMSDPYIDGVISKAVDGGLGRTVPSPKPPVG